MAERAALVTGGSSGIGFAIARALGRDGYGVTLSARRPDKLDAAAAQLRDEGIDVEPAPANMADEKEIAHLASGHRERFGRLDVLVNNASLLGPSPQPPLHEYPLEVLEAVYRVNVLAPLALFQLALPLLVRSGGRVLNITSDAAVESYGGWGGYGSSKAALDQLTAILAAEHPGLRIYAVDPGDMRTDMHQQAFPGEDISDRPAPEAVVPGFLVLLEDDRPSGRYEVAELATGGTA